MVVEENVNLATKDLDGLVNDLLAVLPLRQVGGEESALLAELLDTLLGPFGILLLLWKIGDEGVGSFMCEEDSTSPADTRVSAGNDGVQPLQLADTLVLLAATVWCWDTVKLGLNGHLGVLAREVLVADRDLMTWKVSDANPNEALRRHKLTLLELALVSHFCG